MKISKGDAGYIKKRKKMTLLKTVLEFGVAFALLFIGISQTESRLNVLTIVAILGCLPASKALVEFIMIVPHHSVSNEMAEEIAEKTKSLTVIFDMVFTSEHNIMPVDCIVISGNTICGYTSNKKTDIVFAAKHVKQILVANHQTEVSVKLFDNYTAFLSRAEGMQNIASVEKNDTKKKEETIKNIILNISL